MFSEEDAKRFQGLLNRKKLAGREYIEACKLLQKKICNERGGELAPDSTEIIRAMREGDRGNSFRCDD